LGISVAPLNKGRKDNVDEEIATTTTSLEKISMKEKDKTIDSSSSDKNEEPSNVLSSTPSP
jgi:hypothetical protein